MNARLKALFGLSLLFVIGIATGVMVAPHVWPHDKLKPFPADTWVETTVADYKMRLSLSDAEAETVRQAARKTATDILRIRGETQDQIRAAIKAMNGTILPSLNDQKRAALEQWLEERRTAMGS